MSPRSPTAGNLPAEDLQIAAMRGDDLDAVLLVEREAHSSPWAREVFVEELERTWAYVDLLRHLPSDAPPGPVRAFVNYWLVHDEVHILNVATHPEHRRRGHARRLLEHVIDFARGHRCRHVALEVRRSNQSALRLYRQHGFRPVGVRPNYYASTEESAEPGAREDAIVMLMDLAY